MSEPATKDQAPTEPAKTEQPKKTEAKAEPTPAKPSEPVNMKELFPGFVGPPSPAPVKAKEGEKKETPKAETKPAPEAKPDEKAEPKAEQKDEAKAKPETPDDKTKLEKQVKDSRDAFTRERQARVEQERKITDLSKQVEILQKKLDGTYEEPGEPSPEERQRESKLMREVAVRTSHVAAVQIYGEDEVSRLVWADDAPFRKFDQDPQVQRRVLESEAPVIEAIKVVKEDEARQKYGSTPEEMRKKIEEEVRAELEKDLREKIKQEMKANGSEYEEVRGLGDVRQAGGEREPTKPPLELESLFPSFRKTSI